eukprot:Hpha_TRINITY_DN22424_c0_g1::TRINITY_DN22424_c0_g1_i1::g.95116::m.95116
MGCGSSILDGDIPTNLPNWLPPKELPLLLTDDEQDLLWAVWTEDIKAGFNRAEVFRQCGSLLGCPSQELDVLHAVADPLHLSYKQCCVMCGVLLRGEVRDKTRMFFSACDDDNNGWLSKRELERVLRLCAPAGVYDDAFFQKAASELMSAADTNKDRRIDVDEFEQVLPRVTAKLGVLQAEALKRQRNPQLRRQDPEKRYVNLTQRKVKARHPSEAGIMKAKAAGREITRHSLKQQEERMQEEEDDSNGISVERITSDGSGRSLGRQASKKSFGRKSGVTFMGTPN